MTLYSLLNSCTGMTQEQRPFICWNYALASTKKEATLTTITYVNSIIDLALFSNESNVILNLPEKWQLPLRLYVCEAYHSHCNCC